MKNLHSRQMVHPILRKKDEKDPRYNDYDGEHQFRFEGFKSKKMDERYALLCEEIILDHPDIKDLVHTRQAEFAVKVQCTHTAHYQWIRTSETSFDENILRILDKGSLSGSVILEGCVLTIKDITNFSPKHLNDDYPENCSFDIPRLSPIATVPLGKWTKGNKGIFKIIPTTKIDKNSWKIDMDKEEKLIGIRLGEELHKEFWEKRKGHGIGSAACKSIFYIPAMMEVLHHLSKEEHGHKEKKWFEVLLAKGLETGLIQEGEEHFPTEMDLGEAAHKMVSSTKEPANLDDLITGWKELLEEEEGRGNFE